MGNSINIGLLPEIQCLKRFPFWKIRRQYCDNVDSKAGDDNL